MMRVKNHFSVALCLVVISLGCALNPKEFLQKKNFLQEENITEAIEAFREEVGDDARIVQLTLISDEAVLGVSTDENAREYMNYSYSGRWVQSRKSYEKYYSRTFSFSDLEIAFIRRMTPEVIKKADLNSGELSKVEVYMGPTWSDDDLVSKQTFFESVLNWMFEVSNSTEKARLFFDKNGRFLTTNLQETTRNRYVNFFEDEEELKTAAAKIRKVFGGKEHLLSLTVRNNIIFFRAQDPEKSDEVNEYKYEIEKVRKVSAVKEKTLKQETIDNNVKYEELFFELGDISFADIPQMITEARNKLEIEDGLTYISVNRVGRRFGKNNQIEWRVNLSNSRKEGSVEFDVEGNFLKVNR